MPNLAFFVVFLFPTFSHDTDQRVLLYVNVTRELTAYRISPETYSVRSVTDDHLVIAAREGSQNSVEEAIRSFPADWEKDPRFLVLLYHHHLGCRNSWRSKTSPSLHITQIGRGVYSVDIDLHAPSFRHPVESVKHLKEIVWHMVSRTKTDQGRISMLLSQTLKR